MIHISGTSTAREMWDSGIAYRRDYDSDELEGIRERVTPEDFNMVEYI